MVKKTPLQSVVDDKYTQTYISNYFRRKTKSTARVGMNKENDIEEPVISPRKRPRPIDTDSEHDTESTKRLLSTMAGFREEVNGIALPIPLPSYYCESDEEDTRITLRKRQVRRSLVQQETFTKTKQGVVVTDSSDEDFEPSPKITKKSVSARGRASLSVEKVNEYLEKYVRPGSGLSSRDSCSDVGSPTTSIGVHRPRTVSLTPTKKRPKVLQNIGESPPVSNKNDSFDTTLTPTTSTCSSTVLTLIPCTSTAAHNETTVTSSQQVTPPKKNPQNVNECTTLINSADLNSPSDTIVCEPDIPQVSTPKKKVKILENIHLKTIASLDTCSLSPIKKPAANSPQKSSLHKPGTSQALDLTMKDKSASLKAVKDEIKDEDKKKMENQLTVKIMKKIVDYINSHAHLRSLLTDSEAEMLERFFAMPNPAYLFFCFRLFTRMQKWYNIIKLANELGMYMSNPEIGEMYYYLADNRFVDTDYSSEQCADLLNLVLKADLKDLCQKFKIRTGTDKKPELIQKLLKNCNQQATLTCSKTIEKVLKEGIGEKLGLCVKLSPSLYGLFSKIHLLYSFTTLDFATTSDLHHYISKLINGDIVMPKYKVNTDATIFLSVEDFRQFAEACECANAALQSIDRKETAVLFEICDLAYTRLQDILEQPKVLRSSYLMHFTPGYVYTRTIFQGAQLLARHYPLKVSHWLTCLIDQNQYCLRTKGAWYDLLIMVQYRYLKDHDVAANTMIEALKLKNISQVHLYDLYRRAEMMKKNKSNNVSELLKNKIAFVQPPPLKEVPIIEIRATIVREGTGQNLRCRYIEKDEYSQEVVNVEELALKHYFTQGYPNGIHCEGSLMQTIFFVLFWDIIYDSPVRDAFVQEIQYFPLDLMSVEFYTNRKAAIDRRLAEIELKWPFDQLKIFMCDVWGLHKYEKSFLNHELVDKPEQLFDIIMIIGRDKIRIILEKMAKDFKTYKSGHPDLFVWSVRSQKCKFVEVKSENDRLSTKQELWLEFLLELGTDVEVCHVYSRGCRKIPKSVLRKKKEEKES